MEERSTPCIRTVNQVFETVTLTPITADDTLRLMNKTKPSAAGPDHFLPGEIKILSKWSPGLMQKLAQLFAVIENTSKRPKFLVKGSVSFIPKTDDVEELTADQYRPITVLSAI